MQPKVLSALICNACFENYDTDERAPCVASCGHSVCSVCYKKIQPKCPTCSDPYSFIKRQINYQFIAMIADLQELKYNAFSELNKNCRNCNEEVDDHLAYTCISCSVCVKSASADDFLAKAHRNRFCYRCVFFLKHPHHSRRLMDVQMAVKSKHFAETAKFGNCTNVLVELDNAVIEAKNSLLLIEKQFPFGKKASGYCSDEKLKELKATASASLEIAAESVKEGIAAIYNMAQKLAEVSNSLSRLSDVVIKDEHDNKFLDKINFDEKEYSFFDDKMLLELDAKRTIHKWAFNSHKYSGDGTSVFYQNHNAVSPYPNSSPCSPPPDISRCKAETRVFFLKDMVAYFSKK